MRLLDLEILASCKEALDLKDVAKNSKHRREVNELRSKEKETAGHYRTSPLVSDLDTWTMRISETRILGPREISANISEEVRALGFALMIAGLRVNLDAFRNFASMCRGRGCTVGANYTRMSLIPTSNDREALISGTVGG